MAWSIKLQQLIFEKETLLPFKSSRSKWLWVLLGCVLGFWKKHIFHKISIQVPFALGNSCLSSQGSHVHVTSKQAQLWWDASKFSSDSWKPKPTIELLCPLQERPPKNRQGSSRRSPRISALKKKSAAGLAGKASVEGPPCRNSQAYFHPPWVVFLIVLWTITPVLYL